MGESGGRSLKNLILWICLIMIFGPLLVRVDEKYMYKSDRILDKSLPDQPSSDELNRDKTTGCARWDTQ